MEFKQGEARGNNKDKKEAKKKVKKQIKNKLGITVDGVKVGTGSTNDGNTARKFFEHPEVVGEITGVNLELIKRFGVLMQVTKDAL